MKALLLIGIACASMLLSGCRTVAVVDHDRRGYARSGYYRGHPGYYTSRRPSYYSRDYRYYGSRDRAYRSGYYGGRSYYGSRSYYGDRGYYGDRHGDRYYGGRRSGTTVVFRP